MMIIIIIIIIICITIIITVIMIIITITVITVIIMITSFGASSEPSAFAKPGTPRLRTNGVSANGGRCRSQ